MPARLFLAAMISLGTLVACGGRAPVVAEPSSVPSTSASAATGAAGQPAASPVPKLPHLLLTHAGGSFTIAPAPCADSKIRIKGCAFEVSYEGRSRAELSWTRAVEPYDVVPAEIEPDPGETNTPVPAEKLTTGEEQTETTTTARALMLAPGVPAVLVDQLAGFEHVKGAHFLFAAHDGKLNQVWSYEDGQGPTSSVTAVVAVDADHAGVLLVTDNLLAAETDAEADDSTVRLVRWDGASKAVAESTPAFARAAAFGPYPSLAAAKRARTRGGDCLAAYAVLPAAQFVLTAKAPAMGKFVVASVAASEAGARRVLDAAVRCKKGLVGSVAALEG